MRRPGNRADEIRRAPAPQTAEFPARQIAERRADGNGEIEDGEDAIAVALGIEIGQHGGRVNAKGGLAHAHQRATHKKAQVGVNKAAAERGQAPDDGARNDERLAAVAVA